MSDRFDIIIIGAGAAGLAAARDLTGGGKRVCLLEARQRIGGRVWTLHQPGLPLPIELGAEFVHGSAEETFAIVDAAALLAYELPDTHWLSRNGKLELIDVWSRIDRVLSRIPAEGDRSFADFLESQRHLSKPLRQMARSFAEGYYAAHADRISAQSLRAEADHDEGERRQCRIANGYDTLIESLRSALHPGRTSLRLGSAATNVEWRRGDVRVDTSSGDPVRGRAAVITIPIGVWKAPAGQGGGIRFDPPLHGKRRPSRNSKSVTW